MPPRDYLTAPSIDPIEALTRRRLLTALPALGLIAAIGCGDDDVDEPEETPEATTLQVTNAFGTFDVPAQPQRVIGWEGRRDLETALALGLSPIAIGSNAVTDGELAPYIPESFKLEDTEVIEQTEPDLERLIALEPDLILTRGSNIERVLDTVRTLAPLIPVGADGPWRPELEAIGTALGRSTELDKTLAEYDDQRDDIKERHAERIESATIAVVQYFEDDRFYSSSTTGFYLQANTLADLGGTHLAYLEEGEGGAEEGFSAERTGELAGADAIILIVNTPDVLAKLEESTLWQQLPAVTGGNVVTTDFRTNYGSVYAAMACLRLLDEAYETLA